MGGVVDSVGGFLGLSDGPKAPGYVGGNRGLGFLNDQMLNYGDLGNARDLYAYAMDPNKTAADALSKGSGTMMNAASLNEFQNQLATGATTGSKFATEQVMNNPLLSGLYGKGGALQLMGDDFNNQMKDGLNLTPSDKTMYGQVSGDIARQFGQQESDAASNLASRGLSSSGAAGAAFSGLSGNKNEMLAKAQQGIMQQRFQNVMNQANTLNQMGLGAQQAINQQYGRQLAGVTGQHQALEGAAGLQQNANSSQNSYNMQAAGFEQDHKPTNFMDFATAGAGQGLQSGIGGAIGGPGGMFSPGGGGGSKPAQGTMPSSNDWYNYMTSK